MDEERSKLDKCLVCDQIQEFHELLIEPYDEK